MVFVLYFCLYLYLYLYLYVNFLAFYILDQLHSSVAGRVILLSHRSHGWGRRAACYAVDLLTFLHTRLVAQSNSSCFAEMAAREETKQKCALENGLLVLLSGLLAFVCVALHRESKEHCQRHLFFKNWDILGQMGDWFVFRKLVKYLKLKLNRAYSGSFVFKRRFVAQ